VCSTLLKKETNETRRIVEINNRGKSATSIFNVIKKNKYTTFLKANLITGRTHQLRVHLSYLKNPILGDSLYSDRKNKLNKQLTNRLCLHSYSLEFIHPTTKKTKLIKIEETFFKKVLQKELSLGS
jgi:23S rRNA pseudouridine1911/1915/1917 synthase